MVTLLPPEYLNGQAPACPITLISHCKSLGDRLSRQAEESSGGSLTAAAVPSCPVPGTPPDTPTGVVEKLRILRPATGLALAPAPAGALVVVRPPAGVLPPAELPGVSIAAGAAPPTAMVILRVLVDIVTK